MTRRATQAKHNLLVEPCMPDRSKGRGQTKCIPSSSKFGVDGWANDYTPEKFTVTNPTESMEEEHISLSLSLRLRSPLDLGSFFSFLILYIVGRTLWTGISPSRGRYTGQHKHKINAQRHPCLKRDSTPRPQCSSGRRRFMLQTARPQLSAEEGHGRGQDPHRVVGPVKGKMSYLILLVV
jgi:hypothetical protein